LSGVAQQAGQERQCKRKDAHQATPVVIDRVEVPPGEGTGLLGQLGRNHRSGLANGEQRRHHHSDAACLIVDANATDGAPMTAAVAERRVVVAEPPRLLRVVRPRTQQHDGAWPTDYNESSLLRLWWALVNVLQMVWFVVFTGFLFVPTMMTVALCGNTEAAFGLGRALWGPLNLRFGFAGLIIEGREHLPAAGTPYVMMLNHQSMIDIVVVWLLARTGPRFVAKKALLYVPLIGWFMWLMGMVPVDRGNRAEAIKALRRVGKVLKQGHVLACFPEGTRTRDGRIGPLKKGVFLAAMAARVPIVPVAIEGCAILVPADGWRPRPVQLRARVGAPISTDGRNRDDVIRDVRNSLIDLHLTIGGRGGDKNIDPVA
jgi:1-acyl-sn-glycerol-3-phosphate acyltransferase